MDRLGISVDADVRIAWAQSVRTLHELIGVGNEFADAFTKELGNYFGFSPGSGGKVHLVPLRGPHTLTEIEEGVLANA